MSDVIRRLIEVRKNSPTVKIIGIKDVVTETIKKEFATKNTKREIIERETRSHLELECGHLVDIASHQGKIPTNRIDCRQCGEEQTK